MLRQRSPRQRDEKHLAFVRAKPCCVCGSARNVEAAHIRMACPARGKPPTGMQEKPDDRWSTPLCNYHHQSGIMAQHKIGEQAFWFEVHGRNPFDIAERLWIESGGAERALKPKLVLRVVRTAPRKPPEQRRKIPAGRPLQSRGFERRPS
ncbi:DUF968 domain-containing protein [Bradyrhizobium sp. AUGA SZCCT0160]|uniref:DUF968 domain-containing protein n=1 Tax=Bradyrhizobium sp. AUGA SZCCT0160 TaxID=2807662 RepID=UPI001BADA17E|nr:DUF968 domain-containing protein [Bradyrhizobium sp. AUGA SZCCT0160]MBR1193206.1 DUF968 domain-containing protein [Bradyrhizobium sp. AUGA SZCCT0160]